jgi:hypothetical protein
MKTKTPKTDSAAVTARTISRMLRKAGFVMSDTSNPSHWTDGLQVRRLGCSQFVKVSYWANHAGRPGALVEAALAIGKTMNSVRKLLVDKGYPLDKHDTITCKHA